MLSLWKQYDFTKLVDEFFKEPFFDTLQLGIEHRTEKDGTFVTTVDLPGVSETDVVVEASHGYVRIKGTKKTDTSSDCVSKSFSVPERCNVDKLEAHLKDGVLTLTMPSKSLPGADEVKRIPVNVGK